MPTLRDPDHLVYYKPDGQGLLVGGYEPDTLPFGDGGIPSPFQRRLLDPNLDRFEQLAELATKRTPVIERSASARCSTDRSLLRRRRLRDGQELRSSTTSSSPPASSTASRPGAALAG